MSIGSTIAGKRRKKSPTDASRRFLHEAVRSVIKEEDPDLSRDFKNQ